VPQRGGDLGEGAALSGQDLDVVLRYEPRLAVERALEPSRLLRIFHWKQKCNIRVETTRYVPFKHAYNVRTRLEGTMKRFKPRLDSLFTTVVHDMQLTV
jgi:hypothetical protein